ncbi:hypothetical protein PQX77_019119, partial [Marasmius sp. AFHP31]
TGIRVMRKRQNQSESRGNRFFQVTLVTLFVLATISVPVSLACDTLWVTTSYWEAVGLRSTAKAEVALDILQ